MNRRNFLKVVGAVGTSVAVPGSLLLANGKYLDFDAGSYYDATIWLIREYDYSDILGVSAVFPDGMRQGVTIKDAHNVPETWDRAKNLLIYWHKRRVR